MNQSAPHGSVGRTLCWVLAALFLGGVSHAAPSEDRDAKLLAYVEVWNSGEVERLDGLVAPDFQRHAGPDESCRSLAELKRIITNTRAIYDHLEVSIDDHMAAGDRGAFRGTFHGVHKNVNRVVQFPIMSIVRFADGLIAQEWIIGDNFLPLMGLGYELVPPGFEVVPPSAPTAEPSTPPAEAATDSPGSGGR